MEKILTPNKQELKEAIARSIARILKEEVAKGQPLTEGFLDKVKTIASTYGLAAAIGIAGLYLSNEYGMSDSEVEQIEQDMKENPDKYFGPTYDNGGLDYDAEHAQYADDEEEDNELNESLDTSDFAGLSDLLANLGWAYTGAEDVVNKTTGQHGIRYNLDKYPNNPYHVKPLKVDVLKSVLAQEFGDKIIFSTGTYRYAPEIKVLSIVILTD